jgi:probable rRNA maturation factor
LIAIDIIESDEVEGLLPVDYGRLHDYAVFVIESSGIKEAEINIVFVGDEKMTGLNETYRKRKGTTDVLSFNLSDNISEKIEGEVYVSLERAKNQSSEYDISFGEEVVRLVTHGLLHLTGRVHDTVDAYRSMTDDTEKMVRVFFDVGGSK